MYENNSELLENVFDTIVEAAIEAKASDISFIPNKSGAIVKFRICGVPIVHTNISHPIMERIVSRIMIEMNLPIATKHSTPLYGVKNVKVMDNHYIMKVNIIPIAIDNNNLSHSISIRIVDTKLKHPLELSNISDSCVEKLKSLLHNTKGVILFTGPMGNGKSTLFYSCIDTINTDVRNVMTLEETIETFLPNIMQSRINPVVGHTYVSALKSIAKHDIDVIGIDLIKDAETLSQAINLTEQGKLVLGCIQANNSVGALMRIINMGTKPNVIVNSINAIVSQKLLRTICPYCKTEYIPSDEEQKAIHSYIGKPLDGHVFYRGKGCKKCNNTGYLGNTPVNEILIIENEPNLCHIIQTSISKDYINNCLNSSSFRSMLYDGYLKVYEGLTTFEEIERIL